MSAWRFDFEAARHAAIAEGQALLLAQEARGRGTAEEELIALRKLLQSERMNMSQSQREALERAERLAAQPDTTGVDPSTGGPCAGGETTITGSVSSARTNSPSRHLR